MKARLAAALLVALTTVGLTVAPSYAADVLPVSVIPAITPDHPDTAFQVTAANHTGSYTVHWTAERADSGGGAGTVTGDATGTLGAGGVTEPVAIAGSTITDGHFTLYGTITVSDPDAGAYEADLTPTGFDVRRTKPSVATATTSRSTIFPNVNTAAFPATTKISMWDADTALDYDLVIRNSAGTVVRRLDAVLAGDYVTFVATWNGRTNSGAVVAPGVYKAYLVDAWGNASVKSASITVNTKKLILKTYRATVSAAGSTDSRYAGKCSTLRRPSLRGWAGSLGYYSNSRCGTQAGNASVVTTVNSLRVPAAAAYKDVRVSLYGGAATTRAGSHGVLSYMTTKSDFVSSTSVGASVGNHNGLLRGASGMVFSDRYFVWSFGTAYKNRYDVKNFTVTLHYYVLG